MYTYNILLTLSHLCTTVSRLCIIIVFYTNTMHDNHAMLRLDLRWLTRLPSVMTDPLLLPLIHSVFVFVYIILSLLVISDIVCVCTYLYLYL